MNELRPAAVTPRPTESSALVKQEPVLKIEAMDQSTTDQIWSFVEQIAQELMAKHPETKAHDVDVEIKGVKIKIELQFQNGQLCDFIPSIADEACDGRMHVDSFDGTSVTIKDIFESRMTVLLFLVERKLRRASASSTLDREGDELRKLASP